MLTIDFIAHKKGVSSNFVTRYFFVCISLLFGILLSHWIVTRTLIYKIIIKMKKNDFGNKQKNLLFRNSQPKKVMFMDVDWEWMNVCLLVGKCKNLKIILNDFIVENQ